MSLIVTHIFPGDTLLCVPKDYYKTKMYKLHLCALKEIVVNMALSSYFPEKILLTEKKYTYIDSSTWAKDVFKK